MTDDEFNTILTALHERKNRLIELDMHAGYDTNGREIPGLRHRITEVNAAIRAIKTVRDSSVKFHGAAE